MATVFISYETTTGLEFAKHLQKALEKFDIDSFVAKANIDFGKDPYQTIQKNLEECTFFVTIITITAVKSPEVKKEFQLARKLQKCIIPCVKEGIEKHVEEEFKEIRDCQYLTFETKEDLANSVVETILKEKILSYKDSLRRLKEPVTREELVNSLVRELLGIRDEIYFWLTEPDVDPNEQYVFRTPIAVLEKRKREELQKIKKDITDQGSR